jgi:Pyruvate/2-oxoacid:ferredoxin oxidoreductase delta subunit
LLVQAGVRDILPSALIHYFSGTGNTRHAACIIERRLKNAGYSVQWRQVGRETDRAQGNFDIQVFAFPVYACDAPDIMLRYLRRLPKGNGAKAAVLAINGSISATSRIPGAQGDPGFSYDHAHVILAMKGYDVFFSDAAPYPHSITELIPPPDMEERARIMKLADGRVEMLAGKIVSGERSVKHNLLLAILYVPGGWMYNLFGRRFFGKLYVADGKCISCGKCVKACPASTIRLSRGKPRWGWNCEGCQRCINACPKDAIQGSFPRLSLFIALFMLPFADWAGNILQYTGLAYPSGIYGGLFDILLWIAGYVIVLAIMDNVFFILETLPFVRRLMEMNFTYTYGRYKQPDTASEEQMQ